MLSALAQEVTNCQKQLIAWRRQFHQYPELRLECYRTAEIVAEHLHQLGFDVQTGIAESGVVGIIRGEKLGPTVALRVDMDALPIHEATGLPFASKHAGMMHACGHDGHTAIGLGVATVLSHIRGTFSGMVKCIFQPGEESPGGARIMIEEGVLDDPAVEMAIGFHLYPALPFGTIGVCSGTVTAGCYDFQIQLKGVGGHAARPHQCKDPITAAGHLIVALQTIVSRRREALEPLVISIGHICGGSSCNVIPEEVILKGTIRYVSEAGKTIAIQELHRVLNGIHTMFDVETELAVVEEEPMLHVPEAIADTTERMVTELLGQNRVSRISQPSMGAEDFAFFSQRVPCAYFRLGCYDEVQGYIHGLHTPYFDFDEDLLTLGTQIASFLILKYLET
jgi:amidohydrolase